MQYILVSERVESGALTVMGWDGSPVNGIAYSGYVNLFFIPGISLPECRRHIGPADV